MKPSLDCRFFKTDAGNEPVRDCIGRPLVDASFGGGLAEVRSNVAGEQYRVFFCIVGGAMILLHGFHKKTKATPQGDLDLARTRQAILGTRTPKEKGSK